MERTLGEDRLYPVVAPLVEKMGYSIVELVSQRRRSGLHVHLVIYRIDGVGVRDCEEIYHAVLPRIEANDDRRDIHLEVSSPGLTRRVKSGDEFSLFVGRRVNILMENSDQWVSGTILGTDDGGLTLGTRDGEIHSDFASIRRARLEDAQGGQ